MDIEIPDTAAIHVNGDLQIILPRNMVKLPKNEIEVIVKSRNNKAIIACCYKNNELIFITGNLQLMKINTNEHSLPNETCMPINCGSEILFPYAFHVTGNSIIISSISIIEKAINLNLILNSDSLTK